MRSRWSKRRKHGSHGPGSTVQFGIADLNRIDFALFQEKVGGVGWTSFSLRSKEIYKSARLIAARKRDTMHRHSRCRSAIRHK